MRKLAIATVSVSWISYVFWPLPLRQEALFAECSYISDKAQIDNHKTTKRKYTLVDLKYRAISHSYLREALFDSAPAQKVRVGEFYYSYSQK